MLVKVEPIKFALLRDPERAGEIYDVHESERYAERRQCNDAVADDLGLEKRESAMIKKPVERSGVIRTRRTACPVLTAGKKA